MAHYLRAESPVATDSNSPRFCVILGLFLLPADVLKGEKCKIIVSESEVVEFCFAENSVVKF